MSDAKKTERPKKLEKTLPFSLFLLHGQVNARLWWLEDDIATLWCAEELMERGSYETMLDLGRSRQAVLVRLEVQRVYTKEEAPVRRGQVCTAKLQFLRPSHQLRLENRLRRMNPGALPKRAAPRRVAKRRAPRKPAPPPTPETTSVPVEAKTILLVEDNEAHAEIIRKRLQAASMGISVDVARSLQEMRQRLAEGGADLVVLDLNLPDSKGVATVEAASRAAARAPILVLTALDENGLEARCLAAGAKVMLGKGIRVSMLRDMVHSFLGLLPQENDAAAPPVPQIPRSGPSGPEPGAKKPGAHILLVEDNPDHAELIRCRLQVGASFETLSTLADLRQRVSEGGVDLVLLDLNLPDSKGIDTVEAAVACVGGVPIVVLTSHRDPQLADKCAYAGAFATVEKGSRLSTLHLDVKRALGKEAG